MEALVKERGTYRLLTIDIDHWDSDVASQHGIRRLPSLRLYRGTELLSDDSREVFAFIQK